MKVLITHELFPPDFAGGGEYVVLETARNLIARGVEVQVITTGDPCVTEYEGIPTLRLPVHRYLFNFAFCTIARHARNVDVIHTFNYNACFPSLVAGRIVRKPVICTILGLFRDAWKEMRPGVWGHLWMAWERMLLTLGYARTIFLSDYSRDQGVALGVNSARAAVNSPGIEPHLFAPTFPKEDVVFFTGKFDVRKGIDDVLEIARRLPHVRFRVMGWGPREAQLRASASSNVEFIRFDRGEPLRQAFASARIFISPTRAETFGIAVVQAMAAGCAIISTIPLGYEGVRLQSHELPEMIDAVSLLWRDREKTDSMGKRNVQLAGKYTWEHNTDTSLSIYEQVVEEQYR